MSMGAGELDRPSPGAFRLGQLAEQTGGALTAGADQQDPLSGPHQEDRVPGREADAADDPYRSRGLLGPVLAGRDADRPANRHYQRDSRRT